MYALIDGVKKIFVNRSPSTTILLDLFQPVLVMCPYRLKAQVITLVSQAISSALSH